MDAATLRWTFLSYFGDRGHAVLAGASLVPENDPSVLFTTAGMHPLVPYLLGEAHPAGKRLASVQKCLRTDDIDEVGDDSHLTLFEMLGNWSLGDYGKWDAIRLAYRFLTETLGLASDRLAVTCFAGDAHAPKDEEAAAIWRSLGIPAARIAFLGKQDNWWGPAGSTGPCGPDTEVFYDLAPTAADENPAMNPGRFLEVWNLVFMQYDLDAERRLSPLGRLNVDTGMGLERMTAILEGVPSLYDTELFMPLVEQVRARALRHDQTAERIIVDHTRAATFILAEGISPGNVDQPYVARRLIRRAHRQGRELGIEGHFLAGLADAVIGALGDAYPELEDKRDFILAEMDEEEARFRQTLRRGENEFEKAVAEAQPGGIMPGRIAFRLFDTYGFPIELTQELASRRGLRVDTEGFQEALFEHQKRSRAGAAGRFRGGLSERRDETVRLHTATHLLHTALRLVLGEHVEQRGSNITVERLRFDFPHPRRLRPEEIAAVENSVNEQIARDLPITWEEMSPEEARAAGATGLFQERYGDRVKVYSVGDFSKEICGGPHVERTGLLGRFRILKEESVGSGLRRIRAVLEDV